MSVWSDIGFVCYAWAFVDLLQACVRNGRLMTWVVLNWILVLVYLNIREGYREWDYKRYPGKYERRGLGMNKKTGEWVRIGRLYRRDGSDE